MKFIFKQPTEIESGIFAPLRQLVGLVWSLAVRAFLLGEGAGMYDVAFWAAANRIVVVFIECLMIWVFVLLSGKVK